MLQHLVETFYDWLFHYLLRVILESRRRNDTSNITAAPTNESEEQPSTSGISALPETAQSSKNPPDETNPNCNIQVCYLDPTVKRVCKFDFNVPKSMTVREIKSKLATRLCDNVAQTPNLAIVFMGKELSDNLEISGCDLGDYSILHALDVTEVQLSGESVSHLPMSSTSDDAPNKLSTKLLTTIEENDSPINQSQLVSKDPILLSNQKLYFYVYCHNCGSVRNGKLRVACSRCNASSILCHREPCNWSDVIEENQIAVQCYNPDCAGHQQWARFFFKCVNENDHHETSSGQVVPLVRVRYNYIEATCLACFEARLQVLVFFCGHVLCLDCFSDYSRSSLSQRKLTLVSPYGFTVNCPLNCDKSWLEASHFYLLESTLYTLYTKIQNEEITRKNGGIFCPYPDCDQAYYPTMRADQTCYLTRCDKCQKMWCVPCTYEGDFARRECFLSDEISQLNQQQDKSANPNVTDSGNSYLSELIDKFKQIALGSSEPSQSHRWQDAQSRFEIQQIARRCPQCRVPTERVGGCMHISCEACAFEWCWICQTEWTRDCMTMHWFG